MSKKGYKQTTGHKLKISRANKGKPKSLIARKNMSIAKKRAGIIPPSRAGKKISEEHKQKISKELDQNNWVYLTGKSNLKFSKDHPGFNTYHFGNMFNVKILLKILFKKKKFDEIYCDSLRFLRFLRLLQPIHKAALLTLKNNQKNIASVL